MMIGARTAAWAKSGYTAKDYVQDGLIAMWDGIENAGWGVHDPNATVWRDLLGDNDITFEHGPAWDGDCAIFDGYTKGLFSTMDTPIVAFEMVLLSEKSMAYVFDYGNLNWFAGFAMYLSYSGKFVMQGGKDAFAITTPYKQIVAVTEIIGDRIWINNQSTSEKNYIGWGRAYGVGGNITNDWRFKGRIYSLRFYSRFDEAVRLANYAVDKARFNLPDVT